MEKKPLVKHSWKISSLEVKASRGKSSKVRGQRPGGGHQQAIELMTPEGFLPMKRTLW
jgi:hypothetical protein